MAVCVKLKQKGEAGGGGGYPGKATVPECCDYKDFFGKKFCCFEEWKGPALLQWNLASTLQICQTYHLHSQHTQF